MVSCENKQPVNINKFTVSLWLCRCRCHYSISGPARNTVNVEMYQDEICILELWASFYFIIATGAGDNAISCSVMLEMLRVFSVSEESLQHNLIFLFNGAEENLLQVWCFQTSSIFMYQYTVDFCDLKHWWFKLHIQYNLIFLFNGAKNPLQVSCFQTPSIFILLRKCLLKLTLNFPRISEHAIYIYIVVMDPSLMLGHNSF